MIAQEWHVIGIVELTSYSRASSLDYVASTCIDGIVYVFAIGTCSWDIIFVFVLALELLAIIRLMATDPYHGCLSAGSINLVFAIANELIGIYTLLACLSIDHAYVTQPLFISWNNILLLHFLLLRRHLLDWITCPLRRESIVIA